jgi:hypothetical protein
MANDIRLSFKDWDAIYGGTVEAFRDTRMALERIGEHTLVKAQVADEVGKVAETLLRLEHGMMRLRERGEMLDTTTDEAIRQIDDAYDEEQRELSQMWSDLLGGNKEPTNDSQDGYTYDIDEALLPRDERPFYVTVSVSHPKYGTLEVITNKDLEGRFQLVSNDVEYYYKQVAGTLQFSLPKDEAGIKRELARLLRNLRMY